MVQIAEIFLNYLVRLRLSDCAFRGHVYYIILTVKCMISALDVETAKS